MKLKASSLTYVLTDASGYRFTVTATLDPDLGWAAKVELGARGFREPDGAIEAMVRSAKEFIRLVAKGIEVPK